MLDALHDGLVLHAADGRITEWNAAAERLLGLTTGQLVGRTSIDPVWRLVSGALAVFRDVTAIESGGVGTALLDEQARVTFANAALAGILEVSREELLGCSLRRFVQRTDPVDALLDDMERGRGSLLAQDVCIATGHGEVRWIRLHITSLAPVDGERAALLQATDITERRRLADELARADEISRVCLDSLDQGVMFASATGGVVRVNSAVIRITGYRRRRCRISGAPASR